MSSVHARLTVQIAPETAIGARRTARDQTSNRSRPVLQGAPECFAELVLAPRHIFEPFRRGNAVRPASGDGLGLGLFITREVIEAHGGKISVTSSEVAGTSFVFTVPRRRQVTAR